MVTMPEAQESLEKLLDFTLSNSPLFVLTGAGCSTDSGIPDYRDHEGNWKFARPVQYADFLSRESTRKRYWARSMLGWPRIHGAQPNAGHLALARLEYAGFIQQLVTQNVDGLHGKAGSRRLLDLHGNLDQVICIDCRRRLPRAQLQEMLLSDNAGFAGDACAAAPDGDAAAEQTDYDDFRVPGCAACNGILKPDVVFFGESIPRERNELALRRLHESAAILIIGSSLMVFSGYRFLREAAKQRKPRAAINLGITRGDKLLDLKWQLPCSAILDRLAECITGMQAQNQLTGTVPRLPGVMADTDSDACAGKQQA